MACNSHWPNHWTMWPHCRRNVHGLLERSLRLNLLNVLYAPCPDDMLLHPSSLAVMMTGPRELLACFVRAPAYGRGRHVEQHARLHTLPQRSVALLPGYLPQGGKLRRNHKVCHAARLAGAFSTCCRCAKAYMLLRLHCGSATHIARSGELVQVRWAPCNRLE